MTRLGPLRKAWWDNDRPYDVPVFVLTHPLSYVMVLDAVRLAPLSHVAPAREVSMLFAALIGGSLLGESDRWMRRLGALAIAVGVVALALG